MQTEFPLEPHLIVRRYVIDANQNREVSEELGGFCGHE